jgi:multiple sugar transport system ATP-binding protein
LARVVLENITKTFAGPAKTQSSKATSSRALPSEVEASGKILASAADREPSEREPLEREPSERERSKALQANGGRSQPVLSNINLTVDDGEFMVLVGPSGCGKSTLLRLISGLETLTSGDISVGDRTINHLAPKQRDIAMVFQSYALYPHLSVYDNLAFGLRRTNLTREQPEQPRQRPKRPAWIESALVGLTRRLPSPLRYQSEAEQIIAQRVLSVAQMLQIKELLHRLPKQLSGGQKQRVALGRAMARNPQVFLMDEPLSNLDAKLRTETRAQIVGLQKQLKTTTIYVTHDQTEAMTMGDRIAVMNQGKIQQVAPPLEIYRHPANRFVAAFIGSPPMNFLPVTLRASQLVHAAFSLALPANWQQAIAPYSQSTAAASLANPPFILGIRPEHIAIGQCTSSFPAIVTQLEALGSETFVVAKLSPDDKPTTNPPIQIRVCADQPIEIGSTLQISFPIDKIHLFDATTDLAIRPEQSSGNNPARSAEFNSRI